MDFFCLFVVFSSSVLNLAELSSSISSGWQLIFFFPLGFSFCLGASPDLQFLAGKQGGWYLAPAPGGLTGVPVQSCQSQQEDEMPTCGSEMSAHR